MRNGSLFRRHILIDTRITTTVVVPGAMEFLRSRAVPSSSNFVLRKHETWSNRSTAKTLNLSTRCPHAYNIPYVGDNVVRCNDKDVRKMPSEARQVLSSSYFIGCGLLELHFLRAEVDLVRVVFNESLEDFDELVVLEKKR